jgi:uncharacterized protein
MPVTGGSPWRRAGGVTRRAATGPATGKSTAMDIHHWWRFRDGKICFYRSTEDTAQTQDLLHKD